MNRLTRTLALCLALAAYPHVVADQADLVEFVEAAEAIDPLLHYEPSFTDMGGELDKRNAAIKRFREAAKKVKVQK